MFATIAGEDYGVSSGNVDDQLANAVKPEIRRLLGGEGELGAKLGLGNDFGYNVIKLVGNYEEIYTRNLGEGTPHRHPAGTTHCKRAAACCTRRLSARSKSKTVGQGAQAP